MHPEFNSRIPASSPQQPAVEPRPRELVRQWLKASYSEPELRVISAGIRAGDPNLGNFIRANFEKSPGLARLSAELGNISALKKQRTNAWSATDRHATEVGKQLQPRPIFAADRRYGSMSGGYFGHGGGFDQYGPPVVGVEEIPYEKKEAINRRIREIYDRGREDQVTFFRSSAQALDTLEDALKQPLTIGFISKHGGFWLPLDSKLETLREAVVAVNAPSIEVQNQAQLSNSSVGIPAGQLYDGVMRVEKLVDACIERITTTERTLAQDIALELGMPSTRSLGRIDPL